MLVLAKGGGGEIYKSAKPTLCLGDQELHIMEASSKIRVWNKTFDQLWVLVRSGGGGK